jgi:hypothetical protein
LSALISAWNVVLVKRTARKERFSLMWEMDADVLQELYKVHLTVQLQHAAARMMVQVVMDFMKIRTVECSVQEVEELNKNNNKVTSLHWQFPLY